MIDIQKAFDKAGRGTRIRLAEKLGITHGAISQWTHVPAGRVLAVESFLGIPKEKLRPDLYKRSRK
jgi:DNA-binding transcriptional regulator YdaS (Cro superfamily)